MITNSKDTKTGKLLLFCEPQNSKLEPSVNDELTEKISEWLKCSKKGSPYKGVHVNHDGYESDNYDHYLPTNQITHSLAVHYLRNHRSEIPEDQLEIVHRMPTVKEYETRLPSEQDPTVRFFWVPFIDNDTMSSLYAVMKHDLYRKGIIKDRSTRIAAAQNVTKDLRNLQKKDQLPRSVDYNVLLEQAKNYSISNVEHQL